MQYATHTLTHNLQFLVCVQGYFKPYYIPHDKHCLCAICFKKNFEITDKITTLVSSCNYGL